jgi:hypothetical protein
MQNESTINIILFIIEAFGNLRFPNIANFIIQLTQINKNKKNIMTIKII